MKYYLITFLGGNMADLDWLVCAASTIQRILPFDSAFTIVDKDGRIIKCIQPKTFTIKANEGELVAPGGSLDDCVKKGTESRKRIPKEVYGVPFQALSTPVYQDGNIIGVIASGVSFETQVKLQEAAQTIASTSEEISATVQELAATACRLATQLDRLKGSGQNVLSEIRKTDNILRFVSEVAANSNLLGLNAAIKQREGTKNEL